MTHDITTLAHLTGRESDATLLGTIAGAAYHEICYVLKTEADGSHQIVGRASDWPLIQLRAKNAELGALLTAETAHAAQAEQHVAELLAKQDAAEQHVAALRAELDQAALIPPAMAAAATGLVVEPAQLTCPDCPKRFGTSQALAVHRTRAHGTQGTRKKATKERATKKQPAPLPSIPLTPVLLTDNPAWRCAACHQATFARSLRNPDYCQRCAKDLPLASTNGHALEVGATNGDR